MRKVSLLILFSLLTVSLMAAAPTQFEKYWERGALIDPAGDNDRNMGVWAAGDIMAVVNRGAAADAIKLYNATTGLPNIALENLDMGSIPAGTYNIVSGDFTEDGVFIAASLSYAAGKILNVYAWDTITTGPKVIYSSGADWLGYRLGDSLDVMGSVSDNSATVLISGNNAASLPLRLTTADNGVTWTPTSLSNAVQAQDIDQIAGGAFFATYSGGNIIKYNADGTVAQDMAIGSSLTGMAIDEVNDVIYAIGFKDGYPYMLSYSAIDGTPLDNFVSDPIDANGVAPTGYFNGSAAVELKTTPGGAINIFAMTERQGVARYSYSSEVTVPGDYASIQGAIDAYSSELTTASMPLVISVDPASGPYDEEIDLYSVALPGDIVIKSSDPATKVQLACQPDSGGDALTIQQNIASVIFKDFVIYESLSGSAVVDEIIRIDEPSANSDFNWVELWNVIIPDINASGEPMITSRAEAFDPPVASGSQRSNGFASALQLWGDAGESQNLLLDNVILYGNPLGTSWASSNFRYAHAGLPGEQLYMNNIIMGWDRVGGAGSDYSNIRASGSGALIKITGDSITDGALNAGSVFLPTSWHSVYMQDSGIVKIDNLIGLNTGRTWAGGSSVDLSIKDSIFYDNSGGAGFNVVMGLSTYAQTFENCTFYTSGNSIYNASAGETLTLKNCIFAGPGNTAFSNVAPDVDMQGCAFVLEGPDAMDSIGAFNDAGTSTVIFSDPAFASKDITSENFMDVTSPAFVAANDGSPLVGGADYVYMFEYVGGEYANGDTNLLKKISNADLIEGKTLAVTAGGWYVLAGNQEGVSLTNGIYDANGVADLYRDNVTSPVFEAIVLEYDFVTNDSKIAQIDEIVIFAGHADNGSRAFINCDVAVDTGSGYAALGTIMTGDYGKAPEAAASAWAKWLGSQSDVEKIQFTFYDVSHNSTGYFQKYDDKSAPANNFPNQGAIIKEIDVIGSVTDAPSGVDDWMLF